MKSDIPYDKVVDQRSPPSRAAWIEIYFLQFINIIAILSPPSRAAWIEITI